MRDRDRTAAAAWGLAAGLLAPGHGAPSDLRCLEPPVARSAAVPVWRAATLPPPPPLGRYAFTDVNVVPMDVERVLPGHTVIVAAGRIDGVGPDGSLRIPPGTTVVDGRGRWLVPGLTDAHTHERPLPEWPDDVEGNLAMYLANGVTSLFNMGDFTGAMIAVRDAVGAGILAGPTIYVGHFVRGAPDGGTASTLVSGTEEARALVERARAQRYDFLKVYDGVPAAAYDALVAAAAPAGLPVTGHSIRAYGLTHTLSHGQVMIAHADAFLDELPDASAETVAALAERVAASGAAVTGTLFVFDLIAGFGLDALAAGDPWARVITQPGVEYMDDRALEAWVDMYRFRSDIRAPVDRRPRLAQMRQIVKAFADHGVPVLLGADTIGIPGVVPGFSIQEEVRLLHAAGLTPWQTLAAGTRNAGEFARRHLPGADRFGVVEIGARADLLLLDEDPLGDPSALTRPAGVMAGGRWYPRESLAAQLEILRRAR